MKTGFITTDLYEVSFDYQNHENDSLTAPCSEVINIRYWLVWDEKKEESTCREVTEEEISVECLEDIDDLIDEYIMRQLKKI